MGMLQTAGVIRAFALSLATRSTARLVLLGVFGATALNCSATVSKDDDFLPALVDTQVTGVGEAGAPAGNTGGAAGETGEAGAAGAAADDPRTNVTLPWPSSGCGQPLPAEQIPTITGSREGYTEYSVMQNGATLVGVDPTKAVERAFWVRVPETYDPNVPLRVVYQGQGCGTSDGPPNFYALFNEAQGGTENAIYVAVSLPTNMPNSQCYDNRAGPASQEWEAFDLIHSFIESKFCVDGNRVYVSGYSTGGWLSNMWGCYFAGLPDPPRQFGPNFRMRGQAAVTGGLPDVPPCNGMVAAIWIHDEADPSNQIQGNYEARDRVLAANGCADSETAPWGEDKLADICLQYTACPKEYPVVFCTTTGTGHTDQPSNAIPAMKQFFELTEAAGN